MDMGENMEVLIVDDDMATVDVILHTVNWNKLQITDVFIAYNIADAKKILERNHIDIIISDIEMPQGSGVELLEWYRLEHFEGEFLFLTCHERFDYAKTALKNGVSEYLIKPFDVNIMEAALKKIILKIHETKNLIEDSKYGKWAKQNERQLKIGFLNQVLSGYINWNEPYLESEMYHKRLHISRETNYRLIISKITNFDKIKEKINQDLVLFIFENIHSEVLCGKPDNDSVISREFDRYCLFITVYEENQKEDLNDCCQILHQKLKQLFSVEITTCISEICKINDLYQTFKRNCNLLEENVGYFGTFFYEKDCFVSEEIMPMVFELNEMEQLLFRGSKVEFLGYIKSRIQVFINEKKLSDHVLKQGKEEILQAIYTYLGKKGIQVSSIFQEDNLQSLEENASQSVIDMIRWVNFLLECTFHYEEEIKKQYQLSDIIDQYILSHYMEDISRSEIAKQVHLAPEYVAKVYKKQTGKNLKERIVECRIEQAKILLERGERVSEVAEKVGFDNFTYFSTLFKKYTGVSPNQYRKQGES